MCVCNGHARLSSPPLPCKYYYVKAHTVVNTIQKSTRRAASTYLTFPSTLDQTFFPKPGQSFNMPPPRKLNPQSVWDTNAVLAAFEEENIKPMHALRMWG